MESPPTVPCLQRTPAPWLQLAIAGLVLAGSSVLLFSRLGHYALWDDEAITALTAKGVWATGDTSAIIGHNVLAYRNGLLIRNMKDRATPPLQFYLAAPSLGILGDSALAARLPFALCGLGCVGLVLWWLHRHSAPVAAWVLVCLALLGNASFFLFSRQCRYYGLAMLLGTAVAYSYLHLRARWHFAVHAMLSTLLLAANYMTFAAVSAMLLLDYLLWGRRRTRISAVNWVLLLLPQVIVGAIIVLIWNPLRIAEPRTDEISWLRWHATLLWWHVRDLNACEFGVGALLLVAPAVAWLTKSTWLLRGVVALVVGIVVISIISPQNPSNTRVADVRYLSFLIPLCAAIGAMTLLPLVRYSATAAIVLAAVAFGSNLLHFTWVGATPVRSTPLLWVRELNHPIPEPFTPTASWIIEHVGPAESVLVVPPYAMYPLMFHAPHAVYAWQLNDPPPEPLAALPPIHIALREPPQYIVAFGPGMQMLANVQLRSNQPVRYEQVGRIDRFWKDQYRPELFWRRFTPPDEFDPQTEGIRILQLVPVKSEFRL